MYSLLFRSFVRTPAVVAALLLTVLIGIVSIYTGKQFVKQQEDAIAKAAVFQREHIGRNVQFFQHEMGLLLYYLRFGYVNKPDHAAALSIGQRDINPSIRSVTIRTLEAQKHDTDLHNPLHLASGNLDLGFVVIYLFPLLVIAFTFNLYAEEKEGGTIRLVAAQYYSVTRFLLRKLAVRGALIYIVLLVLFSIAFVVLSLQLNAVFLGIVLMSFLYVTFWVMLCFVVVTFRKASGFNALVLLSLWIVLAILIPAGVNTYIVNRYPVPEALRTIVAQRDGYHEKWDMDKKVTMDKFYAHYPQFSHYGVPQKTFSWIWYYAMQQMGDDESVQHRKELMEKIMQRDQASHTVALVIPTLHTQLAFNDMTGSGLRNHLGFLSGTEKFHEKLRLYFYPRIFDNAPVNGEDWSRFELEFFGYERDVNWVQACMPLLVATLVLFGWCAVNVRRFRLV